MTICISADQALIKRTCLFGSETSSDNILGYAQDALPSKPERKSGTETSTTRSQENHVCLMQMLHYRSKSTDDAAENDDQSWRVRYMGLLCMSQIYKHLQAEPRHKTLSNLLWMFIDEYKKYERDDRVLEALKVGRVRRGKRVFSSLDCVHLVR